MKILRPYQKEALESLKKELKVNDKPILVNASVGAGKSLIIAELLKWLSSHNWNALCITMNSSLISQNAETYRLQGSECGVYCAELGRKEHEPNIIFASPHSVISAIKKDNKLAQKNFQLIVVDECHGINPKDTRTMYLRIFNHYDLIARYSGKPFRIVGLTGTPYRGKNESIVGEFGFFDKEVCNISASWLIDEGYLVKPLFGRIDSEEIDFSSVKLKSNGQFDQKQLRKVISQSERLTWQIMQEVKAVVKNRKGAFIFASTVRHCKEVQEALLPEKSEIITGDVRGVVRERILSDARCGKVKYLINVNCLITGVDIPNFDTVVFVRPTESLVLYTQALGRGLRLCEGKTEALILDYAGNIDRHGDIDEGVINEALRPNDKDDPSYAIPCPCCSTLNKDTARRCIGLENKKRCDHYFEFKECSYCDAENDITSRYCHKCEGELINPNEKLSSRTATGDKVYIEVEYAKFWLTEHYKTNTPIFGCYFKLINGTTISENYYTSSDKAKNVTYARFIKEHYPQYASDIYPVLNNLHRMKNLLNKVVPRIPNLVECVEQDNKIKIKRKFYPEHPRD